MNRNKSESIIQSFTFQDYKLKREVPLGNSRCRCHCGWCGSVMLQYKVGDLCLCRDCRKTFLKVFLGTLSVDVTHRCRCDWCRREMRQYVIADITLCRACRVTFYQVILGTLV
jgi:hypothetical protein